ncbi:nitrile hydratase subunit beta [Burkholderia pseudomallei]|uniref:nitrile hydratase subunit beta n=1 Tax=Burkholderia pseudomallei TaxID=28450 RepID=UPI0018DE53D2|nr:nitrile hydratase subunit beta [Burkholderia pseudomallei]
MSYRGNSKNEIVSAKEKECRADGLGKDSVGQNGYYERWISAAADILTEKQLTTPDEISRKIDEVRMRLSTHP